MSHVLFICLFISSIIVKFLEPHQKLIMDRDQVNESHSLIPVMDIYRGHYFLFMYYMKRTPIESQDLWEALDF
jgi:hypothetical protein